METKGELQQEGSASVRAYVLVRGIVQGVGFRPFVHRIAHARGLTGWVLNSTEGVEIEVEGQPAIIGAFLDDLAHKAPPAASIHKVDVHYLPPAGYASFVIEASLESASGFPLVSPDIATCPDCLAELFDPGDRRHRYPLINCTNCGPRFTIVEGVPYDRPKTTMRAFTMCPTCQQEYDDPANRRFHAQPNACPECGPALWGESVLPPALSAPGYPLGQYPGEGIRIPSPSDGRGTGGKGIPPLPPQWEGGYRPGAVRAPLPVPAQTAVDQARHLLEAGRVVAVKGLGGFHLACDATNAAAVSLLRTRKQRVEKPFAIMVRDLETASRLCYLSEAEAQLLSSSRRPIVLLERRAEAPIVEDIAPRNRRLGVMLPYTPVHHLLFESTTDLSFDALVMTSGNLSEEPIAKENDEALARLASLADYFLLHDRPIHARCDDSVTQVFDGMETIIRRSRGYAPLPVRLNAESEPVLACGASLKSTFCLAKGSYAFLSQHIGDLENQETLDFFAESIVHFSRLFDVTPRIVAHDLHPDYLSTRYARSLSGAVPPALFGIQHHHAHVASCMAESGLCQRVIGVAFDGTGYGTDGTIWGGEFLLADLVGFERAAHLKPVALPGGEAAIKRPYRMALSYLAAAYGTDVPDLDFLKKVPPLEADIVKAQIDKGINSPPTSSCGRLFDAVSALIGVRGEVNYEGQAAIELEMAARPGVDGAYVFRLTSSYPIQIDASPVIRSVVEDLRRGEGQGVIAARFHNGVAAMIGDVCHAIRDHSGESRVCLSGGVFQNRFLLGRTLAILRRQGFDTYIHHQVPCNDGGISLGQAIVAGRQERLRNA